MPPPAGPSGLVIIPAAIGVVALAAIAGATWGAKAFVGICLVASILAGLLITRGK